MTKLLTIAKDQLHVAGGYLLDADDNIIAVPYQCDIQIQFGKLLHDLELAAYVAEQPDYSPAPTTVGFGQHEHVAMAVPDEWALQALAAKELENEILDAALQEVADAKWVDEKMHEVIELVHFCEQEEFTIPDDREGINGWDERVLLLDGESIMLAFQEIKRQKERTLQGPSNLTNNCNCKPVVEL